MINERSMMPKIKIETSKSIKVYHATTEHVAKQACVKGLFPYDVPVFENGSPHSLCASTLESICLTSVYPGLLAFDTANLKERWGVIEIDFSLLEQSYFAPHERFLLEKSKFKANTEEEYFNKLSLLRQEGVKKHNQWRNSLDDFGFCLYSKPIPLQAISRVVIYDPLSNPNMTKAMINCNLKDHVHNLKRHHMLSRWLLGDHLVGSQWIGPAFEKMQYSEQAKITSILQNKNGLDIYYFGNSSKGKG